MNGSLAFLNFTFYTRERKHFQRLHGLFAVMLRQV